MTVSIRHLIKIVGDAVMLFLFFTFLFLPRLAELKGKLLSIKKNAYILKTASTPSDRETSLNFFCDHVVKDFPDIVMDNVWDVVFYSVLLGILLSCFGSELIDAYRDVRKRRIGKTEPKTR
jgi:Na+/H+-dicarboxylate symporter